MKLGGQRHLVCSLNATRKRRRSKNKGMVSFVKQPSVTLKGCLGEGVEEDRS